MATTVHAPPRENEYRHQNLRILENEEVFVETPEDKLIDNIVDCLVHRGARLDLRAKLRKAGSQPPNEYMRNHNRKKKQNG